MNMHLPTAGALFSNNYMCNNFVNLLDSIDPCTKCGVCQCVSFTELHKHGYPIVLIVVEKSVNKQTTMYGEYSSIPLYQAGFAGLYMNMQIPVVLCCGKQVHCLPTNYDIIIICCESHKSLILYQVWCVSVFPFLSYTNMHIPVVLAVVYLKQTMGMLLFICVIWVST